MLCGSFGNAFLLKPGSQRAAAGPGAPAGNAAGAVQTLCIALCVSAGRLLRTLAWYAGLIQALTTPEPLGSLSRIVPHGSTTIESPCVSRPLRW
jgi:hypothetical protein